MEENATPESKIEDRIIQERKEKIIKLLKRDKYFFAFSAITVLSLAFSLLTKVGVSYIIGVVESSDWFILAVLTGISSIFAYYKKRKLVFYPILAWLVWLSVKLRTRNLSGLRDVTTGAWTLGPDLDPFLFTRWAKHIVENGELMVIDTFRYAPLGFETKRELLLHPYLISWFHKIAVMFGSTSVEQSAALFPVFMFALTVIAFFLMTRKVFLNKLGNAISSSIALIASLFLIILPTLLPRTIAGIPEKESSGFFFLFLSFYLFLSAWKSDRKYGKYVLALLAGISTAGMALVWGGYVYIFITLSLTSIIIFILGQFNRKKFYIYSIWLFSALLVMFLSSLRYSLSNQLTNPFIQLSILVFTIIALDILIFNTRLKKFHELKLFYRFFWPL